MSQGLLIRADADERIGVGHVMRCLAIAQAWQDEGFGPVWLASAALPEALRERWRAEGASCLPVGRGEAELAKAVEQTGASWVVLDGYELGPRHQEVVQRAGRRSLVVDDHGTVGSYVADLVVDQNVVADPRHYLNRSAATRLLLGPTYALLRRELREPIAQPAGVPSSAAPAKIFVSFGGADPPGLTGLVLEALASTGLRVTAVVGPANVDAERLTRRASEWNHVELVRSAANMREVMAGSALAVVAAGVTCLELAHAGVPQIVVVTADNQGPVAEALVRRGVAQSLGQAGAVTAAIAREAVVHLLGDADARRAMSARGRAVTDGRGAVRVVAAMK
ncbi:MAG: UDP-2,4-diacetamido-2,4,6-trideoxy-beta-L-altropyranose hydrolase [Myxococcales bacterium]|nr:UDP-2,4-diacetamido-2,4,6-trideoxy-beta-L-altropyranose hydrolase [Myxococcales bacterium]